MVYNCKKRGVGGTFKAPISIAKIKILFEKILCNFVTKAIYNDFKASYETDLYIWNILKFWIGLEKNFTWKISLNCD